MSQQLLKKYGQHFLTNPVVLSRMLATINPKSTESFLEIGPGNGVMTFPIAAACKNLHAIEIDERFFSELRQRQNDNMNIICGDAQAYDFRPLLGNPIRLIGNLPYNIAVVLIERLLEFDNIIDMHFLVQKEIAVRLFAEPGEKNYGRLSLLRAANAGGESLFEVGAGSFRPPPKVRSSFIRLIPQKRRDLNDTTKQLLKELTRAAFTRRNRKLRNTLENYDCIPLLSRLDLAEKRARDTSLSEFMFLTKAIAEYHEKAK